MSWGKVKIGEVLKQYRIEHRVQNEVIYKQVSILNDGNVVLRGEKIGREIGRKRQFLIDIEKFPKTLIFTRQLLLQGSIGLANEEVHNCIVTENMPMFSVIDTKIDVDFLIQFIKSEEFKKQVRKIELTGSAQKSIHEKTFLQLEIPLPPLGEQKAVVKSLLNRKSKVDTISTELTNQLSLAKKLRQQLLQDAVQGKLVEQNKKDEPASALLNKIKAEKEKSGKKEKELPPIKAAEIPFEIPKNWTWCRLGEIIISITGGGTPSTSNSSFWNGNIPWASVKDMNVKYLFDTKDKITELAISSSSTNLIPKGNVIVCTRMGLGKIVINRVDTTINQDLKALFLSKYIDQEYFYSFYKTLEIVGKGMTVSGIRQEELLNYLIPLPPLDEQRRIVKKLDLVMQNCNDLEESIKQSALQNEKLLQQVLREALRKEEVETV